ncbi:hypothetical protein GW17_00054432, partial [Ensete ventricosum]
ISPWEPQDFNPIREAEKETNCCSEAVPIRQQSLSTKLNRRTSCGLAPEPKKVIKKIPALGSNPSVEATVHIRETAVEADGGGR